jgi:hypothetical protein
MGRVFNARWERSACKSLCHKTSEMSPFGRSVSKWEENINIEECGVWCECIDWI